MIISLLVLKKIALWQYSSKKWQKRVLNKQYFDDIMYLAKYIFLCMFALLS
jgi:hypothetical protein